MEKGNESATDLRVYEKRNEGIITRILRWLKANTTTSVIIGLLSVIVALFSYDLKLKSEAKADAKEMKADARYEEAKQNALDVRMLTTAVTLPDSLEDRYDVQRYRIYQNRVYAWELAYLTLVKECELYQSEVGLIDDSLLKTKLSSFTDFIEHMQNLNKESISILTELKSFTGGLSSSSNSLARIPLNDLMMDRLIQTLDKYEKLRTSSKDEFVQESQNKDFKALQKTMRNYLMFEAQNFQAIHDILVQSLTAVNIHLLHIKNEAIGEGLKND